MSPDKKHLVYQEYTIGDPSYYLMNLETLQTVNIPVAMSARWVDNDSVIGASYSGSAYRATTSGEIEAVSDIKDDFNISEDVLCYYITLTVNVWK